MADFPISGRFIGDFVALLVTVDTADSMTEVANKVAAHSVGLRVAAPEKNPGYEVLLDGEVVGPDVTLEKIMTQREVLPLQWFDVRFRQPAPAAE